LSLNPEPDEIQLTELINGFDPKPIYERLLELSNPHTKNSEIFDPIPYDKTNPLHDLSVVEFPPIANPAGIESIIFILNQAYPDWERVLMPAFDSRPDLVAELVRRFKYDKSSFSLILAHERIEDVAYAMAVLLIVMSRHIPYEELVQRFHIVISSILRTMGAYSVPAVDILRMTGWVHFSFPRTDSIRRGGFDENFVSASNRLMRSRLNQMDWGIKAIAAPGSIDQVLHIPEHLVKNLIKPLPDDWKNKHRTVNIKPVTVGTANVLKGYVLPVAGVFSGESQFCKLGNLVYIDDISDIHRVMHWIAGTRYAETGVVTLYHEDPRGLARLNQVLGARKG
jgi:hypothetical protein